MDEQFKEVEETSHEQSHVTAEIHPTNRVSDKLLDSVTFQHYLELIQSTNEKDIVSSCTKFLTCIKYGQHELFYECAEPGLFPTIISLFISNLTSQETRNSYLLPSIFFKPLFNLTPTVTLKVSVQVLNVRIKKKKNK